MQLRQAALALAASLLLQASVSASDYSVPISITADESIFSVALPTAIPVSLSADGLVTCPSNLIISNHSPGAIKVTAIRVKESESWSWADYNSGNRDKLASVAIDSHKIGLQLAANGKPAATVDLSTDGAQNLTYDTSWWVVEGGGTLNVSCDVISAAVKSNQTATVGQVAFTVAWSDTTAPLIHNDTVPQGGIYVQGETVYYEGDDFPEPQHGDGYIYKECNYTYLAADDPTGLVVTGWNVNTVFDENIQVCDEIITEINGEPVTNMYMTFADCTQLTSVPDIPSTIITMNGTFNSCYSLIEAPTIPEGVEGMVATFIDCEELRTAPVIPSSVKNMEATFADCFSLTGNAVINANPEVYANCFQCTMEPITLSGSSSLLTELAETSEAGNVTVAE